MNPFEQLKEFHLAFGHPVGGPFTDRQVMLREKLIEEESEEALEELGYFHSESSDRWSKKNLTKELADLLYVTIGTATAFGLPLEEVFNETHKSNMSKLGEDGKPILREDGKVLKGPNYQPPNLDKYFET